MHPADTLSGPLAGDLSPGWSNLLVEGQDEDGSFVAGRSAAGRRGGGAVGTDAGAESGPYAVVSGTVGPGPRHAAAEELFAAHYPKLAGWVRRLVDDDETAHEIASEAFVRLLSKWTSPDKLDSPQGYLYMIATNLVRDHWRKMERERRALRKATAGADPEPSADPSQDVDVRALLAALPARLREPFLLHYYAGFGVKEIAAQLKKPEGTIKADLYHARARLKEAIAIANATGPQPVQGAAGAPGPGGAGAGRVPEQVGDGKRRRGGRTNAS
jgi:RNA polymerase sigma-70 factor, ECF subfamily